jgi:hypothetical protein
MAACLAGLLMWLVAPAAVARGCRADSPAHAVPVVELYTSEGCSSCPPADRWLSHLDADAGVVALAFHVDYWDRLGWTDRFASPRFTQRQAEQRISSGARFSYTPQVLLDGIDRKDWSRLGPTLAARERPLAPVALTLVRDGARFIATVRPLIHAPHRLAAYWAVTEQNHVSVVRAGENVGATLRHDHVVREYLPVAAWDAASAQPTTLDFKPSTAADPAHPRTLTLVVVDAATGRPVQALGLGC